MCIRDSLPSIPIAEFPAEHDANVALLFSESTTRFLVEVTPEKAYRFEQALAGMPCASIGIVLEEKSLRIRDIQGKLVVHTDIETLSTAWQGNTSFAQ